MAKVMMSFMVEEEYRNFLLSEKARTGVPMTIILQRSLDEKMTEKGKSNDTAVG